MKIRLGYELIYSHAQPTPMLFMLHAQPSASQYLSVPDQLQTDPWVPSRLYFDVYGNACVRLTAPAGRLRVWTDAVLEDSGIPEYAAYDAREHPIEELPNEALVYLLPSRYCESDLLQPEANRLFGHVYPGWSRVQAICDFVNRHIQFGYAYARPTKTALDAYREGQGVCRDFAHLGIAFCRAMNIPARYTTSYLGDIGVPPVNAPMDFAGAIEVYLGGAWHAFDPRNNARRIGRLTIARGRDAADVAISTSFGRSDLVSFQVWTDEVRSQVA